MGQHNMVLVPAVAVHDTPTQEEPQDQGDEGGGWQRSGVWRHDDGWERRDDWWLRGWQDTWKGWCWSQWSQPTARGWDEPPSASGAPPSCGAFFQGRYSSLQMVEMASAAPAAAPAQPLHIVQVQLVPMYFQPTLLSSSLAAPFVPAAAQSGAAALLGNGMPHVSAAIGRC